MRYKHISWWMKILLWKNPKYEFYDILNRLLLTVKIRNGNVYIVDYKETLETKCGNS